jgi:hypothetical protein
LELAIVLLLSVILVVLVEGRISIGTKVAVIERDIQWVTASLVKWGMVPPVRKDKVEDGE